MPSPEFESWFDACVERGLTVPEWSKEHGGAGLNSDEAASFRSAMEVVGAPLPLFGLGIAMLGPTIMEFGTDDQQKRHLPKIARGEVCWCQGYSEPGAGSDLASLSTRADDHGDFYLINGSKIWTSGAYKADWIFCLVRTDQSVPNQEGISFLLFPLDAPGITVRTIDLINGGSEFCEAFFDDAKAAKNDLLGDLNGGWTIAKRLLQFERASVSRGEFLPRGGNLPAALKKYAADDFAARNNVLCIEMDDAAFQLTKRRAKQEAMSSGTPTFATSTFKFLSSELESRRLDAITAMAGTQGLGWSGNVFTKEELKTTRSWLLSKGFLIAGGSSEVQRNIVAKRVLGLPD
ncbi:MAG: acyl-CoA dehydrogenase [Pseudomonadales bacterium]|nr:acyl-CoA dehydrogenase [Pseudomonadales bacterium]